MDHPLLRRCLPGISAGYIQRMWDERLEILALLEHFPQTFCHLDAFRRNLFYRHTPDQQPEVVAVDWSYSGIAAVGEEIAPLVHASLSFGAVPPEQALALEQIVLEGYLNGLSEAGWQADPDRIRFTYAATVYWRYALGAFAGEWVPWMLEESHHAAIEQAFGKSIEQIADDTAAILGWVQYIYDQAARLKAGLKENV
jgi:thiamine kinase-like enzyme